MLLTSEIKRTRYTMLQQAWYSVGHHAVASYAKWMVAMDISRHAPLPAGPKIIAANHPTTTDPIWITLLTSEPMHILITEMCFKVPLVGRSLQMAGHVPVVDGHGRAALEQACRLLKDGQTVTVFPEGALSPLDGGVGKPHTGVARLALTAGVPVIPVGIHLQCERIHFIETTVDGKTETARWYLRGPYAITAGEPMRLDGAVEDRAYVHSASERIMQRIAQLARESARRMQTPEALRASTSGRPIRLAGV
jgi:1-acyl-sn-glycerol-3-phosphate acyltransferase